MRFNNKELAYLAHHGTFDKQGSLLMKDKTDGLFKKGEGTMYFFFTILNDDPQFLNNKSSILVTNCIAQLMCMIHNTDDGEVVKYSLIFFYELILQRNVKFIDFCQLLNL